MTRHKHCPKPNNKRGSQVLASVPKRDRKRTSKGTSQAYTRTFSLLYMEDVFIPLIDLVNWSGNDGMVSLWLVSLSVSIDNCGQYLQSKWYGLPWLKHGRCIVCFKQSHHGSWHKYNCPFTKYSCSALELKCCSQMYFKLKDPTTVKRISWQTERTHGLNQRT